MNPNWSDAKDWLDILDHFWIGLVVLAAAGISAAAPGWIAARKNHQSIREIKDQVVNGHADTNLRNDVDKINAQLETISQDLRALRDEIMAVDERRRVQVAGIYDELDHRKRRNL